MVATQAVTQPRIHTVSTRLLRIYPLLPLVPMTIFHADSQFALLCATVFAVFCGVIFVLGPKHLFKRVPLLYRRLSGADARLEQDVQTFDFVDTQAELDGLSPPQHMLRTGKDAIPSVIHFIWGLRDADLTFVNYLAIRSALLNAGVDEIKLHYFKLNKQNEWFLKLQHDITLVPHRPEDLATAQARASWHVAHLSDVLRLEILFKEGGIYLDMDVFVVRPFTQLLANPKDAVLGHEGGNRWGLCNAIIMARPQARFLGRWIENYSTFDSNAWNHHSVILPRQMSIEYPDEVCALSPTVFFWPTWTFDHVRYMHEPLTKDEARAVEAQLQSNGGGLYSNQIAYHAWSQKADKLYLSKLTPDSVVRVATRFNLMMRHVLLSSLRD